MNISRTILASEAPTLIHLLQWRASYQKDQVAYIFLKDGETDEVRLTYGQLDQRARMLGALLGSMGIEMGMRALLLYPPGIDYIVAVLGCLYAGVIAIPAYPPQSNTRSLHRLHTIIADAQPTAALTTERILSVEQSRFARLLGLNDLCWVATDHLAEDASVSWQPAAVAGASLAFLQYTSGSTADPKGVMLSHNNLLQNLNLIYESCNHSPESIGLTWNPPYHDLGLIGGVLQPIHAGFPVFFMSPVAFLQRPIRWLQAISRTKATTSGGPNFAYELCIRSISPEQRASLDLSTWNLAFTSAEPIRRGTLDRFYETFAPCGFRREAFYPCYGLAESTLLVSRSNVSSPPLVRTFLPDKLEQNRAVVTSADEGGRDLVGCGQALPGNILCVVHPDSLTLCLPGQIGEIWVSGPSIAEGYWMRPQETQQTFHAHLAGNDNQTFLRTGDLGFLLDDGELFITGRLKDLIIIRGRNHYPQDIEWTVFQTHTSCIDASGAAFSIEVSGEERLVVVQEIERHSASLAQDLLGEIRKRLATEYGIQLYALVLIRQGSIPKTSSGKIQRQACKSAFLHEQLHVIAQWCEPDPQPLHLLVQQEEREQASEMTLDQQLYALVSRKLHIAVADLDTRETLVSFGFDSLTLTELQHEIVGTFFIDLSLVYLFETSIADVAKFIQQHAGNTSLPALAMPSTFSSSLEEPSPLSYGQKALWFLQELDQTSAAYNLPYAMHLRGAVDIVLLRQTFKVLLERHPSLCTSFFYKDGEPWQRVVHNYELDFQEKDAASWTQTEILEYLSVQARRPFDLEQGQLLRVQAMRQSDGQYVLLLVVHHIAIDFWSFALLVRDIRQIYEALIQEPSSRHEAHPYLYRNYVEKQRVWLAGSEGEASGWYWRDQLSNVLPVLQLPVDNPRPLIQTYVGSTQTCKIDQEITQQLRKMSQERNTTLYVILLAAFEALLYRYTAQEDFFVGSPVAGRDWAEFSAQVGYFVNTLPLRAKISRATSFDQLIDQVRQTTLDALRHQHYPFSLMVEQVREGRDARYSPIFQVMFVWQQSPFAEEQELSSFALKIPEARLQLGAISAEPLALDAHSAQLDLTLMMVTDDNGLSVCIEYNTDLFEVETIQRLLEHWKQLLAAIVIDPSHQISTLEISSDWERELLWGGNAKEQEVGIYCIQDLIEAQVARSPEAVAIVCGAEQLRYRELNERANALAHHLQSLGVGPEVLVGICMERSVEMVIGLLAILKAGGAYVPLDPSYPTERLHYIVQDSGLKLILVHQSTQQSLENQEAQVSMLCWEDWYPFLEQELTTNPTSEVSAQNLAYVIYTSGSTGKPKGVAIQHQSTVMLLLWSPMVVTDEDLAGIVASTSICFDLSIFELFVPLSRGGTAIIVEDALHIPTLVEQECAVLINTVPSAIKALLDMEGIPSSVRTICLAGEALSGSLVQELYQKTGAQRIYNLYGPSEDTTYSTYSLISPDVQYPPIGRPIANTRLYILDQQFHPVPLGLVGELYIAGTGLARGYVNKPEVTASVFLPNPWGREIGERLYQTGDRARWRKDGEIEFLGRWDEQVKLRGLRVELGEIVHVLEQHPQVREAVVLSQGEGEHQRLEAYLVSRNEEECVSESEIRAYVRRFLPAYMIPQRCWWLSHLPLSANGKVDRKALRALAWEEQGEQVEPRETEIGPQTETEQILSQIWAEVLERETIGREENFFEVGGHSLLAIQVMTRLREIFSVEVPLRLLFEAPTIALMAQCIDDLLRIEPVLEILPLKSVPHEGDIPLSFAQQQLWFLDQLEPDSIAYNMLGAFRVSGPLHLAALEQSLNALIERHEVLRTTFPSRDGQPIQQIATHLTLSFSLSDLSTSAPHEQEKRLEELARQEVELPFDLSRGPLLRLRVVRFGEQEHVLLFTLHHIVADGWSIEIIVREVSQGYAAAMQRQILNLPPLPVQYADYALWQQQWLQGEMGERQLAYWQKQLAGAPANLALPIDFPRSNQQVVSGAQVKVELSAELSEMLKLVSQREGVTLFMTMLAAWQVLLRRRSGQEDIVVGSPIAGRNRREVEGLVGFFVNTLALRTDLSGNPSFRQVLQRVREVALEAYNHQDVPFDQVVARVQPERHAEYNPLCQVCFVLQNSTMAEIEMAGVRFQPLELEGGKTPFDLTLDLAESAEGVTGVLVYNTALFERETIERMVLHFRTLLEGMVANPEQRIGQLPLLSVAEEHQLLETWTQTSQVYPGDQCIHELFDAQVARTPEAIAVIWEEESLTYRELAERANQLAHVLRQRGVGPEVRVGVCLERSFDLVVALLAVLKAGGAYVPLDPAYPPQHLRRLALQAQSHLLIANTTTADLLTWTIQDAYELFLLDQEQQRAILAMQSLLPPVSGVQSHHLAYIMYTSGSTGQPKGVMTSHRAVVRHPSWTERIFPLTTKGCVLQIAPYSFDATTSELFAPLLAGARVALIAPHGHQDSTYLVTALARFGVTMIQIVPSMLRLMLEESAIEQCVELQVVYCGGEAMPLDLPARFYERLPHTRLYNCYGPTETTVDASFWQCDGSAGERVHGNIPIGRPIDNTQLYVLDRWMQLVPVGVDGELFIGGDGLARGYEGQPDLTAARFVPHPYSQKPGGRLYQTGDRVRWRKDGAIEFLGRWDEQVKLRGLRVELGEIVQALEQHPQVREAVVLNQEEREYQRLEAYLVSRNEAERVSESEIRAYVRQFLPAYMVPQRCWWLSHLPLSANGKVDRKALRALAWEEQGEQVEPRETEIGPQTETEQILSQIWAEVLERETIGREENFFEVGGHSLLAIQVMTRLREIFPVELPLLLLFEASTIALMAQCIDEIGNESGVDIRKISKVMIKLSRLSDEEVELLLLEKGQ